MKKSIFMVALAALAMTSCSQDEVLEVKKDMISFSTFGEVASRAEITDNSNFEQFKVLGVSRQNSDFLNYINWEKYTGLDVEGVDKENLASGYYWPTGEMDFYAVSPNSLRTTDKDLTGATEYEGSYVTITGFDNSQVNGEDQTDVLYAVNVDEVKSVFASKLNFKHALAQVVFKLEIDGVNQDIKVILNSITVPGMYKTGNYMLPNGETEDSDVVGNWDEEDGAIAYTVAPNYVIDNDPETTEILDCTAATAPMLFIPQTVEKSEWNSTDKWGTNGYFIVDATVEAILESGNINLVNVPTYIPVDIAWEQGKKYIYTLKYTAEGNGGMTEDGKDQMLPIIFDLNVEEFDEQDEETVDMVAAIPAV